MNLNQASNAYRQMAAVILWATQPYKHESKSSLKRIAMHACCDSVDNPRMLVPVQRGSHVSAQKLSQCVHSSRVLLVWVALAMYKNAVRNTGRNTFWLHFPRPRTDRERIAASMHILVWAPIVVGVGADSLGDASAFTLLRDLRTTRACWYVFHRSPERIWLHSRCTNSIKHTMVGKTGTRKKNSNP